MRWWALRDRTCAGGWWWWWWGRLVEEDSTLDGFAADGALAHPVPAQLAGAVAAHEDHVLQPVQTDGTHGLRGGAERRGAAVGIGALT